MNIVCNIDNNYVRHCAVMLTSLLENNKTEDIHIFIIADDLTEGSQEALADIVEGTYRQQLSFINADHTILDNCPIKQDSYISLSTYYRCFIASLLPQKVEKVIYLDCDLIVIGCLKELWNTPINEYALGAVEDMWSTRGHCHRLAYPEEDSYFNAGVLLVNLKYWRKHHIEEEISQYISEHASILKYNDQDALNGVLHHRKQFINFRWNMQNGFYKKKRSLRPSSEPALDKEMPHAVIIHFTSSRKPWHDACVHPYKKLYLKYLDMTIWKGERPPIDWRSRISRLFYPISGWMGWKNNYRKVQLPRI